MFEGGSVNLNYLLIAVSHQALNTGTGFLTDIKTVTRIQWRIEGFKLVCIVHSFEEHL
jgi:hypothetical protein